jgi:hypothetical protein
VEVTDSSIHSFMELCDVFVLIIAAGGAVAVILAMRSKTRRA